jgi:hypothetical protein
VLITVTDQNVPRVSATFPVVVLSGLELEFKQSGLCHVGPTWVPSRDLWLSLNTLLTPCYGPLGVSPLGKALVYIQFL